MTSPKFWFIKDWTKKLREMLCSQHVLNTFITNLKWQIVIDRKKKLMICKLKLVTIANYDLLWKYCGRNISKKLSKQTNSPKSPNQMFNCDILNCVYKRHILKLLFFLIKKKAYFPIASQLVLALIFRWIYWIYVIHLVHTRIH